MEHDCPFFGFINFDLSFNPWMCEQQKTFLICGNSEWIEVRTAYAYGYVWRVCVNENIFQGVIFKTNDDPVVYGAECSFIIHIPKRCPIQSSFARTPTDHWPYVCASWKSRSFIDYRAPWECPGVVGRERKSIDGVWGDTYFTRILLSIGISGAQEWR